MTLPSIPSQEILQTNAISHRQPQRASSGSQQENQFRNLLSALSSSSLTPSSAPAQRTPAAAPRGFSWFALQDSNQSQQATQTEMVPYSLTNESLDAVLTHREPEPAAGTTAATYSQQSQQSTSSIQQLHVSLPIYMDRDEETLTEYQSLLRKQIEIFEAGPEDISTNAQGRNTPILLGQVGLRCRHCAPLPRAARTKGAVYYSQTIDGIYQVAQNMSKVHLCERCQRIPRDIRQKLKALRNDNQRAAGGKTYWSDGVRSLGVYEEGRVLRLRPQTTSSVRNVDASR